MRPIKASKPEQTSSRLEKCKSSVKAVLSKFFLDYGRSFKSIKRYGMKFISMMLIDAIFLLVFYLVLYGGYSFMFKQYIDEIIPIAQSAGQMKSAQTFEEAKNATIDINMKLFNVYNKDKPFSGIFMTLGIFIAKIIIYILLLAAIVSISRAIIWSMVKESFRKFWKFVLYDLMFTFLVGAVFILLWLFVKPDIIVILLTILALGYIYFTTVLRAKFNNDASAPSIFRQLSSNLAAGIKGFIIMAPAIIMVVLTFIVLFNIFGFIFQKLPQMVLGSISLALILAIICWSRIYYYEYVKERM